MSAFARLRLRTDTISIFITKEVYLKGRLSTVDLLVLTSPRACILKLITAAIYGFRNKLECLSLNTRLSWKGLPGKNTRVYYGTGTINYRRNKFYDTGTWCAI